MKVSVCKALVVLSVLVAATRVVVVVEGGGGHGKHRHFITWKDFEVAEIEVNSNWDHRVIVVRQDGLGNSTTVQGAVDMVPLGNTGRVKIYIYPGIYRYVCIL